jgi:hypothetical protein
MIVYFKGDYTTLICYNNLPIELDYFPRIDVSSATGLRKVWRYQRGNQEAVYIEGQAIHWPKEKGQTTIYKTLHRKLKIEQQESH